MVGLGNVFYLSEASRTPRDKGRKEEEALKSAWSPQRLGTGDDLAAGLLLQ